MLVRMTRVARDNGSVIEVMEQTTGVASENDLLLSPFDYRRQVDVISLFELLSGLDIVSEKR